MKSTFHKWILSVMTGPQPTQYTEFDKYQVKTPKSKLVRNGVYGGGANCPFSIWAASDCASQHISQASGVSFPKDSGKAAGSGALRADHIFTPRRATTEIVYIYIHVYMIRERERAICVCMYIYICTYILY